MLTIQERLQQLPEMRLRASSGGDIANGITKLTDIQSAKLIELAAKTAPTIKQMEEMEALIKKRDNPELMDGAKTFTKNWLWENMRQKRMELNNKFLAKGIRVENNSIDIAEKAYGWDFAMKNEEQFEDEFFTGTPDLFVSHGEFEYIVDIKSSWDEKTFKFFDPAYDKGYYYQLQIYMHLTGKRLAQLIYVLTDTPVDMIRTEAFSYIKNFGMTLPKGMDIEDTEVYANMLEKMTYSDLPLEMRVKKFNFAYDGYVIDEIIKSLKACRIYKNELMDQYFKVAA